MMQEFTFRVAIQAIVSVLFVGSLQAQCLNGWTFPDEWDEMPIPVYLNALIDEDLCPSSTCGTMNDIRRTVISVLDEYYHMTGGQLRFRYAGETTEPRYATIDGAIHVYGSHPPSPPRECDFEHCDCSGGTGATAGLHPDGSKYGGLITICRSSSFGGPINWDTFHPGAGKTSFHSVLLHELGHLVGMAHIETDHCSSDPPPTSIMHRDNRDLVSEHLQRPDMRAVHFTWGTRETIGRPKWTPNGTSWADGGGSPPIESKRVLGRFAATNTRTAGNNVYVAWADGTLGVLWFSRYTPTDWSVLSGFFEPTIYHPGVASKSTSEVFLTWLGNRDSISGKQDVLARRSSDGGFSFGPEEEVSDATTNTANAGVTATYDPSSDRYIVIWRGSSGAERNTIIYRVVDLSLFPWKLTSAVGGGDIKAAGTPSIACGPQAVVGEYNCLVAWVDAFHWQRPVRWTQARVTAAGKLDMLGIRTHGYVTVGSPSVAYWSDGEFPWLITLYQGGTTTYTWIKRASHGANFQDQRGFSFRPKVSLPVAGSRVRGTAGRGYVLVTDE